MADEVDACHQKELTGRQADSFDACDGIGPDRR
jgi:hypothetical protein